MIATDLSSQHVLAALILLGVVAVPIVSWFGFHALSRLLTGWKTLAQRFPPTPVQKFGAKYRCAGAVGALRGNWPGYVIEFAQEGFLVTPNFARRSPILIPWPGIREISEVDAGGWGDVVTVTVEYDKLMQFYLPKAALPAIRENTPAERFRKETFSELIKSRANNSPGK